MTQQPNPKNNESDGEQDSKGWEATKEAKKRQQKKNRKQQETTATATAATAGKGGGGDAKQPGPAVEKKDSQQPQKEGATRQRPPPTETIQTKEEEQKKEFLKKLSEEDKELEDWKKYKEFKPSANAKKFQLPPPAPVQGKRVPAGGVVPSDDPEPKVQLISSLMVPSAITEATNYYSTIPSSAMSFADATKKSVIHSRLPPAVIKQGGAGAQVTSEVEKPASPSEPIGASNSVHGVVPGGEQIAEKTHEQPERSSPDVMEPKYVSPRMTKLPAAQMKPKGIDENQLTTANKEGGSTGEEGVQGMELKQDQGQIGKWPDLRMGVPSPAPAQSLPQSSAAHQAYSTGPQFHPYQQQMMMPQQWTMPIAGGQPSSQLSPSLSPFQAATMMPSQQSYHPGYGYYAQAPYYSTQFGAYPYSQQAQEIPPGFPNRQQQMGGGGYGSMQPRYYSQQVPSSSQYPPSGMPSVKPVQQQQYYGSVNSGYNQMPVPFNPQSYAGVPYPAGAQNPQMGGQGPFASGGGGAFPMSDQQHPNPSDYATAFQRQ